MTLDRRALIDAIIVQHDHEPFSGVIYVRDRGEVVIEAAYGLAHRAERIPNTVGTRFGIASGTKTLTSIAVARLVEQGRLGFDARLTECIDAPLPGIDPDVTLHHLLTHSAGVPDYFDEDVERQVMRACGMTSSGFFALDRLPGGTARGYLPSDDGGWRTNAYAVPIVGGADGGAYSSAHDLAALWDALLDHRLVGEATLGRMLTPHWRTDPGAYADHYGYGIWIERREGQPDVYAMVGEDPGVVFHARCDPASGVLYALFGNTVDAAHAMHGVIAPMLEG